MKQKNLTDNSQDLPKWAQTEIKWLQMRLNEAKKELEMMNDNPESNTVLGTRYSHDNEPIKYLKNNQRITFVLEHGEIQAHMENGILDIYASGGDLFVRPKVSNVIHLHLKP